MEHIVLHSIQAALLFFIVSSPIVYRFVNKTIAVAINGCPTIQGLIVHSIVYGVLYYLLVKLNTIPEPFAFRGIVDPTALKQKEDTIREKEGVIPGGIDNTTVNYES